VSLAKAYDDASRIWRNLLELLFSERIAGVSLTPISFAELYGLKPYAKATFTRLHERIRTRTNLKAAESVLAQLQETSTGAALEVKVHKANNVHLVKKWAAILLR
jgi:hypothetical protein